MAKISLVEVVLHCIIIFATPCLYPDNENSHENAELETLFKVGKFKNAIKFKKLNVPHLSKLGLSYRCASDVVMHSNKQTGP